MTELKVSMGQMARAEIETAISEYLNHGATPDSGAVVGEIQTALSEAPADKRFFYLKLSPEAMGLLQEQAAIASERCLKAHQAMEAEACQIVSQKASKVLDEWVGDGQKDSDEAAPVTAIKEFDKATAQKLANEIQKQLKPLAEKYNIVFDTGSGSFGITNMTVKLKVSVKQGGRAMTQEARDFQDWAHQYGLKHSDLFKTFSDRGRKFVITGLSTRSRRYPILGESKGKLYKFTADFVKNHMESTK